MTLQYGYSNRHHRGGLEVGLSGGIVDQNYNTISSLFPIGFRNIYALDSKYYSIEGRVRSYLLPVSNEKINKEIPGFTEIQLSLKQEPVWIIPFALSLGVGYRFQHKEWEAENNNQNFEYPAINGYYSTLSLTLPNTASIRGRVVTNSNGEPLIGAQVFVRSARMGAMSKRDGYYLTRVPASTNEIVANMIGYKTIRKKN